MDTEGFQVLPDSNDQESKADGSLEDVSQEKSLSKDNSRKNPEPAEFEWDKKTRKGGDSRLRIRKWGLAALFGLAVLVVIVLFGLPELIQWGIERFISKSG